MTRDEKCKLITERGYTYDSKTGNIYNRYGKILTGKDDDGYIRILTTSSLSYKKCMLLGHHFAWYSVYGNCDTNEIDHINGERADNRIINLRSVTRQQNQWNRTKAKGYYISKYKDSIYYNAQIYINTKRIRLGSFKLESEARNAYLNAKEKYHVI